MEKCLISVVTVTYNAGEVLERTMESVSGQSFGDYEHMIVDGASKDGTLEIASRRRTERTRIVSEPDKGLYDAMNKALRLARGRYVLFLNAGDTFADSESLGDFAAHTVEDADIVYGDTMIVDNDGKILGKRHLSAPKFLTVESFSHGMLVCHQAFMVKRSIAPSYDTGYRFSADYDWTIRCIKASQPGKRINVGRPLIHYLSDGLTDNNKIASLKERFRIMASHYGVGTAVLRHISFIPRALLRKITK